MGVFEDTMQGLLEAIEMEHGNDCRKEVIKELNLSEKEHSLITEYNHLIATGQFALAVEFLNENPRLLEYHINLLTDDKHKEVIDKMNEVPNNYPHEDDRFHIPKEYKNMSSKQLKNIKKAWNDYYKDREEMRKAIFGEGRRRETNMNERIAQFEKVSYDQFVQDYENIFNFDITLDGYTEKFYEKVRLPIRKTSGSAGYDFVTPIHIEIKPHETFTVPTGIRCKMRNDFVLNIYVRSSIGFKYQTVLANGTGIIDSDYYNAENEGHIMIKLINHSDKTVKIDAGDAFAQGVFLQFGITNDDMADGVRVGGIGSTGKQ